MFIPENTLAVVFHDSLTFQFCDFKDEVSSESPQNFLLPLKKKTYYSTVVL